MTKKGNYIKKEIKLRKRLEDIKIKLEGFKKIYELTLKKKGSNWIFVRSLLWTSVRMIMPIVEVLGKIYFPQKPYSYCDFLKKHLYIPCPSVIWKMYRNAFIHDDNLLTIKHKNTNFNCGISAKGNHIFKKGQILLSVQKLCDDLLNFINSELKNSKGLNEKVYIIDGIQNPPAYITSELDQLLKQSD